MCVKIKYEEMQVAGTEKSNEKNGEIKKRRFLQRYLIRGLFLCYARRNIHWRV